MIRLAPPLHGQLNVFRVCYQGYAKVPTLPRRTRLELSEQALVTLSDYYDNCAEGGALDNVRPHAALGQGTKPDYIDLYDAKFVGGPGRPYYDEIINSTRFCPYCGRAEIHTLDHFLPKDSFPGLAVHTRNLVPCCYPCNRAKSTRSAATTGVVPTHPYFDTAPIGWLACEVTEGDAISPEYSISPAIDAHIVRRLNELMVGCDLYSRFSQYALAELVETKERLLEVGDSKGPNGIRSYFAEQARTVTRPDSWRRRLYEGLTASDWFCSTGYLLIED